MQSFRFSIGKFVIPKEDFQSIKIPCIMFDRFLYSIWKKNGNEIMFEIILRNQEKRNEISRKDFFFEKQRMTSEYFLVTFLDELRPTFHFFRIPPILEPFRWFSMQFHEKYSYGHGNRASLVYWNNDDIINRHAGQRTLKLWKARGKKKRRKQREKERTREKRKTSIKKGVCVHEKNRNQKKKDFSLTLSLSLFQHEECNGDD